MSDKLKENTKNSYNFSGLICTARNCDICTLGRSMIEMLGVLAIIAVLSVGGIAGYSKAMEQWKISRQKEYLAELFLQSINLKDDFMRECLKDNKVVPTADIMEAMGGIPDGLTKIHNNAFEDFAGNNLDMLMWYNTWNSQDGKTHHAYEYSLRFLISQNNVSTRLQQQYCVTFLEQAQAIAPYVDDIANFASDISYNGFSATRLDNIGSAKPNEIYDFCKKCNSEKRCSLIMFFKL